MTPFAKKVYRAVLDIPLGEVRTYKWVARRVGKPKAVRAVGLTLKNNPHPLIIPCHRVIKKNGDLGGFMGKMNEVWETDLKLNLLKIEGSM